MQPSGKLTEFPQFPELTFDDEHHIYRLDGIIIPSVSSIMAPLSSAEYKGISEKTLNHAANRGTSIHNSIENWIKFEIEDVEPEYQGYFDAFRSWYEKYKPVIIGSECRVYHPLLKYGGTIDILAYVEDKLTLVDIKNTYALNDMLCGVQLEAYTQAMVSHGIKVEAKRILHLKKDGSYGYPEYPAKDGNRWRVFGGLKTVYDYIKSYEK